MNIQEVFTRKRSIVVINSPLIAFINTLCDQERQRRNLTTDVQLARVLSISTKTLSLWRNGRSLPKAALVLLNLALAARQGR
jgi:DNA-binding transcriptional regulator YiaG